MGMTGGFEQLGAIVKLPAKQFSHIAQPNQATPAMLGSVQYQREDQVVIAKDERCSAPYFGLARSREPQFCAEAGPKVWLKRSAMNVEREVSAHELALSLI